MKALSFLFVLLVCLPTIAQKAQDIPGPDPLSPKLPQGVIGQKPEKSTVKTGYDATGHKVTRIYVDLQSGSRKMEPIAEPRQLRIDDRANVQFVLRYLSPLDVCSRSASPPTPNTETSPAESLVTTFAGLGGIAAATTAVQPPPAAGPSNSMGMEMRGETIEALAKNHEDKFKELLSKLNALPPSDCKAKNDKEFLDFEAAFDEIIADANAFIGSLPAPGKKCPDECLAQKKAAYKAANNKDYQPTQVDLACEIDADSRELTDYPRGNYRGSNYAKFKVADNPAFAPTREMFTNPIETIPAANALQANREIRLSCCIRTSTSARTAKTHPPAIFPASPMST